MPQVGEKLNSRHLVASLIHECSRFSSYGSLTVQCTKFSSNQITNLLVPLSPKPRTNHFRGTFSTKVCLASVLNSRHMRAKNYADVNFYILFCGYNSHACSKFLLKRVFTPSSVVNSRHMEVCLSSVGNSRHMGAKSLITRWAILQFFVVFIAN